MKIFAISDIHGEKKYFEAAAPLIKAADVVVISGDISRTGDRTSTENILQCVEQYHSRIVGVHGNWDRNEVLDLMIERGFSVHGKGKIISGIGFFGVGGSSETPMNTVNEYMEEEIQEYLTAGYRDIAGAKTTVLISHAPPRKVRDRTFLGLHGGSKAIREFLETHTINLCLTGHIHEAFGVELLNGCVVANSGSFKKGKYSLIDVGDSIEVEQGKL